MTTVRLVLASASPARKKVLLDAGINPNIEVSAVDEEALTLELGAITPIDLALALAKAKADDVAPKFADESNTVIVGCDSVFELAEVAYGKPLTAEVAVERITTMSGQSGLLHTGHWAIFGDRAAGATATTKIHFGQLTTAEIEAYVATGEPLNVAGAFTLDGRSASFITGIEGDPSNVIGISLPTLRMLLRELGITWTDLWTSA
ncbi:MAG: septum formation inhibitor Maf [Candidatus Nanopelagicales bacterium]|nr:septum formation inhibitor Maf [Candidatus Nanopelagicales bacterium]